MHDPLHSNMFLLILLSVFDLYIKNVFTFQYVSINTYDNDGFGSLDEVFFTFQYVSINTHLGSAGRIGKSLLYIPICFY